MKTKFLAWLYATAITLCPGFAWAQMTPQPVTWANSAPITVASMSGYKGAAVTTISDLWDVSAYSSLQLVVYNDYKYRSGPFSINRDCMVKVWVFGSYRTTIYTDLPSPSNTNASDLLEVPNGAWGDSTISAPDGASVYEVGPIPTYVKIRVLMAPTSASALSQGCTGAVVAIPKVNNPTTPAVTGVYVNNYGEYIGKYLKLTADGYISKAGGTLTLGAETLVNVTATAMPVAAGVKSYTFFNTGSDTIYCGFDGTVTVSNGIAIGAGQGATFDLALAGSQLYCITTVLQTAGTGTRTVMSTEPDTFRIYGGGGGGGGGGSTTSTDYAPAAPTNVSCSASTSCAVTGLTSGSCYQFSCSADFQYRAGTGTPTAVTTDNEGKAGVMYRQCLSTTSSYTAFAFISGSGMTCKVAVIPAG